MPDWGAGSPTTMPGVPSGTPNDWGAGSPTPASFDETSWEWGAGSPSEFAVSLFVVPIETGSGAGRYPDEGGVFIVLSGSIPSRGPYNIRVQDVLGGLWPSVGYCYSGKPGNRYDCYASKSLDELRFVLPPVPPGLYDIVLEYGTGSSKTISDAILVVRRNRNRKVYDIRRGFPSMWTEIGPRRMSEEEIL